MAVRSLIVGVEKYSQLQEALAGDLQGTLDTAMAFREWLIKTKQVPEANILFCSEPRAPASTAGATWAEIRNAILELRSHAGNTSELYFFFSGHGYAQIGPGNAPTANALLASDYVNHLDTSDKALSHDEIVLVLRYLLGPGEHFHFVDVCRFGRMENDFPVGSLAIPAKPRETGQATVHVLYSTSLGDAARIDSAFGDALVEGLRGTARAKEWFTNPPAQRKLGIRFLSLFSYIRSRVTRQNPDPNPNDSGPGIIYEFPVPIRKNRCRIKVRNAKAADTFKMQLGDADQQELQAESFKGPEHQFERLPNEYHVAMTSSRGRIKPAGWVRADLFEDVELTFELEDLPPGSSALAKRVSPEPPSQLNVRLAAGARGFLRTASTGRRIRLNPARGLLDLKAGNYELEVEDADGWTVRHRIIEARPNLPEIVVDLRLPASPLHEEILEAVPGAHQGGAADFSESLGPLVDQDPALWIALLGAAQIVRRPRDKGDFYKLRDLPLAQFTRVKSGGSALYLMVGLEEDVGNLRVGLSSPKKPSPSRWSELKCAEGFHRLFHHAAFFTGPRPAMLSLAVGKISVITLATAFLRNRATLVTVTQDRRGALQVHQMMLPLGHLVHKMPETVRDHLYLSGPGRFSRARSVKFIVQAQRAFRLRQDIDSKNQSRTYELQELLYGKWLDPVMAALASYELLRRGKREHLLEVADNLQRYFPDFPDSGALARLVTAVAARRHLSLTDASRLRRLADAKLANRGWPLFLDGLAAFENYERDLPLPTARLDYRGMWTLWRGAVANPNE